MNKHISAKWKIFGLCWTTYVITYLCRVNLSSVMEKLSAVTGADTVQMGLIGSVFFFTYAIGQLINGYLGDRILPSHFIAFAITATGILNLAMSMTSHYAVLMVIWGMNGYVQSMLWGPMMRILSDHFDAGERMSVSTGMSFSMVAGFIVSWAVFGKGFLLLSWQWYFLVPALLALLISILWIKSALSQRNETPKGGSFTETAAPAKKGALRSVFFKERIWLIALTCICLGAVKESVSLWAPTLMTRMLHVEINTSFVLISVIPVANFAGILAAGRLIGITRGNVRKSLLILFLTAAFCAAALSIVYQANAVLSVCLIAAVSGMMYGCNTILLSYVPISFHAYRLVSTLVGIFDFMSYSGAAASSAYLGTVVSAGSYRQIFWFWLAAALLAAIFAVKFPAACGGKPGPRGSNR